MVGNFFANAKAQLVNSKSTKGLHSSVPQAMGSILSITKVDDDPTNDEGTPPESDDDEFYSLLGARGDS